MSLVFQKRVLNDGKKDTGMQLHSLRLNGHRITLRELVDKAGEGDRVSCRIGDPRLLGIFYEVESRGARIFPSLLSQSLSLSKVHQTLHYRNRMIPHTDVLFKRASIRKILTKFAGEGILKTVVKEDHASMGMGDHPCWSLDELARTIIHLARPPLVVQPMLEDYREFRLVICGDVTVQKEKMNSEEIFWKNRMFGGFTKIVDPSDEIVELGKEVMRTGRFPWAYMDFLVTGPDIFLSEINLSGSNMGLKAYKLNGLKKKITEAWTESAKEEN